MKRGCPFVTQHELDPLILPLPVSHQEDRRAHRRQRFIEGYGTVSPVNGCGPLKSSKRTPFDTD